MSETGTPYHLIHRLGRPGIWRPLVGVVVLVVGAFAFAPLLATVALSAFFLAQGGNVQDRLSKVIDTDHLTPFGLGYLYVILALAIPMAILVTWAFHGLRPGRLMSVSGRIRWRFLITCLGLAFVALLATLMLGSVLPSGAANDGTEISGELNEFTATTRDFLLVVLFLTPFQAAGEEYLFRGYLTQAFGGLFDSRAGAIVVPAVLFALAHSQSLEVSTDVLLGQTYPVFIDRLAFGLVAGVLVIVTGGLEAGIAMHVLNNFVAFGLALAFGDMTSALNPSGGSWWSLPTTLVQSLLYLWLAVSMARRMGLRTTVESPVLAGS